jgi:hypothetical protein
MIRFLPVLHIALLRSAGCVDGTSAIICGSSEPGKPHHSEQLLGDFKFLCVLVFDPVIRQQSLAVCSQTTFLTYRLLKQSLSRAHCNSNLFGGPMRVKFSLLSLLFLVIPAQVALAKPSIETLATLAASEKSENGSAGHCGTSDPWPKWSGKFDAHVRLCNCKSHR